MLSKDKQINIDYELYLKVVKCTRKSSFALFLNLIIITLAFYKISDTFFLTTWVILVTFIIFLRNFDIYTYLKNPNLEKLSRHINIFKFYSLLLALIVSCGIIIITPAEFPFHQAFLAMIVAGLSAGAVMALSYYQNLTRLYLVILILPFALLMLLQGSTIHLLISFLMLLFLIMLILFSKTFYEGIIELILSKNKSYTQAHYDTLTNLPNRLMLYDRLFIELQAIKRRNSFAAILFIDIDDFKTINDTYGHHFGDTVLKEFSTAISSIVRAEDTFSRLSGDEFVILISSIYDSQEEAIRTAKKIAAKIHEILNEALLIGAESIFIKTSIGIDIIDEETQSIDHTLNNADNAMYASKNSVKHKTTLFTKEAA